MISCDQVLAELSGYLDNDQAAELRRHLEAHLAQCRTCEAIYDSVRKTLRIVTESRSFELPEEISARLMSRVMARLGKP